jgi:CRP-like cAMP-binding protein
VLDTALSIAFTMGIISACSLPLGTLTTLVWRPRERVVTVLMAFGGGALLAALTIDLVGSALDRGHFYPLALGAVLGGLLFDGLNQWVNVYGGFLRKTSTTIFHLRRQRQKRITKVLSRIGRIDLFRELPAAIGEELAGSFFIEEYEAGVSLYRYRDPSDRLYILEEGEIELLDPQRDMEPFQRIRRFDAFGRMAFFSGSPHATVARTVTRARVWVVTRWAIERALASSETLREALARLLRGEEMATYLHERHGMDPAAIAAWSADVAQSLAEGRMVPDVVEQDPRAAEFKEAIDQITRLPIFRDLPVEEADQIAARIFSKQHPRGQTLFHQGERADRLYIVEQGAVVLVDPQVRVHRPTEASDLQAFGVLSFLTGLRHSVSAVTTTTTRVWVLRKRDFEWLLSKCTVLEQRVRQFLQEQQVAEYLQQKQRIDAAKSARWIRRVARAIDSGSLIPATHAMSRELSAQRAAPVAIWLGILLDGVPESVAIGSSVLHGSFSASLVAGLFLSNYPEALSSSAGMRDQGMRFGKVLLMWTTIMVLTGIGAALGSLFFVGAQPGAFSLVQGIAAGAMLTMIAETMLPEAYLKGGGIIGFTTLLGFLAAIFFKTFD